MSNSSSPRAGRSVATRLSLTVGGMLAAVLLGVSAVLSVFVTNNARERIVTAAGANAHDIALAVAAFDQTARTVIDQLFEGFAAEFPGDVVLTSDGELQHWGEVLNGNTTAVDRFQRNTGGVATVFARQGDDFLRVTTSLRKQDGERAVGTLLGKGHPAYAELMADRRYTGPATLFGTPYMTHYRPLKNAQGQMVGLLFIGMDLRPYHAAIAKLVASATMHETGGVYLVNASRGPAEARLAFHPSRSGEKLADLSGAEGLLAALTESEGHVVKNAPAVLDASHADAWAVARPVEGTGEWVVAEFSESKAMAQHWAALLPFWLLLGGATLGLGLFLFTMVRRWVAAPLAELGEVVGAVAAGDLSRPVHSTRSDEIGTLMRDVERMRVELQRSVGSVRESADSIRTAAAEVAGGNADLSQRTEQAAGRLQQTASAVEELASTVTQTADSARTANQLAASASSVANRGGTVVAQVVSTMDEINTSSRKIADIIGTIDGIAFQTNILALNAAVEAARAGEQGRGFAVVASEVRSLAQRSAEAAKQIKGLIQASVEKVDSGSRLVGEAGTTMNEIVASVQRVTDIIGEISAAAAEQSGGLGQINGAVNELDRATQQNAALVEESAAAAESLREQAGRLAEVVGRFRLQAGAGGGLDAAPTPRSLAEAAIARAAHAPAERAQPVTLD
jgi:methyl-accepting chemotaxis protein